MSTRLAIRFAGYLTKGDVRRLFYDLLVKKYGSIKKASKEAGIERKTIYNLDKVKEISFETKAKVLDAAYRADPLYTLEFLVRVLRKRAGEALFALIDYVKTEAIRCNDPEKLAYYLNFLDKVSEELGAPLREEVSVELNDVKQMLALKSIELGVRIWVTSWSEFNEVTVGHLSTREYEIGTAGTLVQGEVHAVPAQLKERRAWYPEEEQMPLLLVGGY